jgi:hypothetical protein
MILSLSLDLSMIDLFTATPTRRANDVFVVVWRWLLLGKTAIHFQYFLIPPYLDSLKSPGRVFL